MESSSIVISERSIKYEQLEEILRDMISKLATELCNELKLEKKKNPSYYGLRPKLFVSIQRPDKIEYLMDERKLSAGRKMKNPVVGEKVVFLYLPHTFDAEGIKDIEQIEQRLGKWRLQRRQRESTMKDTFYCHLSSGKTFRTIPEVLNFIMFGRTDQTKPTRKRSASDDHALASASKGDNMMISKPPSKRPRKNAGKLMSTSQRSFIDQNTTDSNSEPSIMPRMTLEPQMNMQYSWQCPRKIQLNPEPLRTVLCEPKPKLNQEINMVMHGNNFVDLTHVQDPSVESGIISNSEMSGLTQDNKVDHSISESPLIRARDNINEETVDDETFYGLEVLEEYKELLGGTTLDELMGERNDDNNIVTLVSPHATNKVIGKEEQALITTKPLEFLNFPESSNIQNKNSQGNFGPAENIANLEEATQKLPHVELEGVDNDDEFHIFQHGGSFFLEDHPLNHISIYDYIY